WHFPHLETSRFSGRSWMKGQTMMIDRRLVARLQAMKPGERLILPARYSSELNVRNLLAAAGGVRGWNLTENVDARGKSRWTVERQAQ
ncbi:MAG: hypothetical protein ACK6EB_19100, partial [Planctomyces sp.]